MSEIVSEVLTGCIDNLLKSRNMQGNWGDVRSTALAAWAFEQVLSSGSVSRDVLTELSTVVSDAQTWILGQARREEGGVSWESEVWDTALAILALNKNDMCGDRVDQACAWIQATRDPVNGVWCDEIWETTLASIALLKREQSRKGPLPQSNRWLEAVFKWLTQIPSKESGEFVAPHYCGFLAWLLAEINASKARERIQDEMSFPLFHDKARRAVDWLITNANEKQIWSQYTFSNAYIAYGLSTLLRNENLAEEHRSVFLNWLRQQQGRGGGFEDVEDTSLAVLALSTMMNEHDGKVVMMQVPGLMAKEPIEKKMCFLGYSGAATGVALEVKDYIRETLPSLRIVDWRWNFQIGQALFAQIEQTSKKCDIAIFLITKDDDLMQPSGNLAASPRDNIVFEVGFFAARMGMENTLLIVEQGAKVPSDWGGILYIPLKDRTDISSVKMNIYSALKERLGR